MNNDRRKEEEGAMVLFSRYSIIFIFGNANHTSHTVTVPTIVRFRMSCRVRRRNKIQQLRSKSNSINVLMVPSGATEVVSVKLVSKT